MSVCADTGFIVKLYLKEANSPQALALLASLSPPIFVTTWHVLEVSNAIQRAVFVGGITPAQASQLLSIFDSDLRNGVFNLVEIDHDAVLELARRLTLNHTPVIGTRSLDVLHVASAIELEATDFVSFDQRQRDAAKAEGLNILP
ncbi:type II toxin-antitoxin system VapC family toxin [Phragmitibacter flavus]|uniref:Type II toxin-antitoxin system VapC family toxin n=1 Tax=Phragmitibacter flavus TaxID=2576071 RepID=A0A5R8KFN6_9BACT|nr:type II toxin-antitoxin system VapC family toxin [Phragmitibacter flavus]TLD71122.1 type II toxin-antitoxin system VapC family toxin [Phragmitibacter flavus]